MCLLQPSAWSNEVEIFLEGLSKNLRTCVFYLGYNSEYRLMKQLEDT